MGGAGVKIQQITWSNGCKLKDNTESGRSEHPLKQLNRDSFTFVQLQTNSEPKFLKVKVKAAPKYLLQHDQDGV